MPALPQPWTTQHTHNQFNNMDQTTTTDTLAQLPQRALDMPSMTGISMSQPLTMSAMPIKLISTLTRLSLSRPPVSSSRSSLRELNGQRMKLRTMPRRSPTTERRSARTTGRPVPTKPTSRSSAETSQMLKTASTDNRECRNSTGRSSSSTATLKPTSHGSWTSASTS